MKICVDYDSCTGHGLCELAADDIFELDQDGAMHVLEDTPSENRREAVETAIAHCPTQALSLAESSGGGS